MKPAVLSAIYSGMMSWARRWGKLSEGTGCNMIRHCVCICHKKRCFNEGSNVLVWDATHSVPDMSADPPLVLTASWLQDKHGGISTSFSCRYQARSRCDKPWYCVCVDHEIAAEQERINLGVVLVLVPTTRIATRSRIRSGHTAGTSSTCLELAALQSTTEPVFPTYRS